MALFQLMIILSFTLLAFEQKTPITGTQASTQECANKTSALGMANGTITDSDITSSPVLNSDSYAKFARLGREKAWIPTKTDEHPWIQVNLQRLINITGLATQGLVFRDKIAFIRSYYLSHGDINGTNWMNYTVQGKTKVFQANTDATSVERNDLSPSIRTAYIRLHPINCSHLCALRMEIYGCTEGLPGRPPRPNAVSILPTSINVTWDAPDDVGDGITGYNVQWKDNETSTKSQKVVIGKKFAILDTLSPYTTYSIKIQAFNGKGESLWSLPVINKTAESVPSVAPSNFELNSERSLTLEVAWNAIPKKQQRGKLLGYTIRYTNEKSGIENITDVGPDKTVYTITGLEFASYAVKLAGYTGAGVGIFTDILKRFPREGAPSSDPVIKEGQRGTMAKDAHTIRVVWEEIEQKDQNGEITGYTVFYNESGHSKESSKNTTANKTSILIEGLKPYTTYCIKVAGYTKVGRSPLDAACYFVKTLQKGPSAPTQFRGSVSGRHANVSWNEPVNKNGIVVKYLIKVYMIKTGKVARPQEILVDALNDDQKHQAMITKLTPFTNYTFKIQAFTIKAGEWANFTARTKEEAPGKPREVTARVQPGGSIRVDWKDPQVLNGIIISCQVCLMLSKTQPIVMVDAFCVRRRWVVGC
ncbi:PREDICTED: receptor-type tyrosine-protein phosphatase delta-like isoform X3 [Acropora digitifera]|uniref:receptor-type tyrosine-protein phosphatase delta-like isoform X3 n=1 Tax=Acropora digitifera TaxID=70779 RepID=UPI00077A5FE3|nr:PREDICTED: receptor-type tyrosine-protein phosphatase delta-like isoform X3 [Acropora digitifera]